MRRIPDNDDLGMTVEERIEAYRDAIDDLARANRKLISQLEEVSKDLAVLEARKYEVANAIDGLWFRFAEDIRCEINHGHVFDNPMFELEARVTKAKLYTDFAKITHERESQIRRAERERCKAWLISGGRSESTAEMLNEMPDDWRPE